MIDAPDSTPVRDPVDEALAEFLRRADLAHDRLGATIGREIIGPLRDTLRAAREGFEATVAPLASSLSMTGAGGPGSRPIRGFRQAVLDRVHRPVRATLARLDCGDALDRARTAVADELRAAAAATPERSRRAEPAATWSRAAGDPWPWVWGKALVRARRRGRAAWRAVADRGRRVTGREARPDAPPVQDVPLRRLAEYHVAVRLAAVNASALGTVASRLGSVVAGLETGLSEWLHETLALESALDAPAPPAAGRVGPEAGDAATEPVPAEQVRRDALLGDVMRAAGRLRTVLVDAHRAADPEAYARFLEESCADANEAVLDDAGRIGTFMLRERRRSIPDAPVRAVRDAVRAAAEWTPWFRHAVARLGHDIGTADFRDALTRSHEELLKALEHGAAVPLARQLEATMEALGALRASVERSCTRAREAGDATELRSQLLGIEESANEILLHDFVRPLSVPDFERNLREAAERCIGGVADAIERLETAVTVHERTPPGAAVHAGARTTRIRCRELAGQALDVVLLEKVRTCVAPVQALVAGVPDEGRQLEEVIRFNLGAALDEVSGADAGPAKLDGAEELALNGLDRSIEAVRALQARVLAGVRQAGRTAQDALNAGWARYHERIGIEDRVQEQLLDIRYRARLALRQAADRARHSLAKLIERSVVAVARVRVRVLGLLRLGQVVVEGERVSLEQRRSTAEALATVESLLAALPIVYRRLFGFLPVTDPALLVGRDADLEAIRKHYENWRMGITDALILSGGDGSGRTSLLGVARETILGDTDVHVVELRERCLDERSFIALIAPALPAGLRDAPTFPALISSLHEAAPPERPRCIVVEGLEHALLRTAGGNGLLGRVLALMSGTDSRIFWLASISRQAWEYVERTEPMTPKLVRHYPVAAPTRDDIEQIIMKRHVRSGLPILFAEPGAPSVALRRRLRRAADRRERQAVLRAEYFDRLQRAAGSSVTLALFYWLRSAGIDAEAGTLNVREFEALNFGYLDELSLSQCFALKAFLDHGSLTVEEYGRVFGAAHDEPREMFESLGNLLLIEPVGQGPAPAGFRFSTIAEGQRYRIRPLVVHPVTRHLHGRNLLLSPA